MSIKQRSKSLQLRHADLAKPAFQLNVLNNAIYHDFIRFSEKLKNVGFVAVTPSSIKTLQINIGKLCNQSCAHCHVDAGPDRVTELMSEENLEICIKILKENNFSTLDITGGAPEMHPKFRWFITAAKPFVKEIIVRCNLTIIVSNPKYNDLPAFYAKHQIHIISSLPYFSKIRTDSQRGDGVFDDSIIALKKLNSVGYGMSNTKLILDLVYNPSGAFLPASQVELEQQYKKKLHTNFGIHFNNLFTITNMPISRFLEYLQISGNFENYMEKLVQSFNPHTLESLMCRNMISVSWDGFNQMLDLKIATPNYHIRNFNTIELLNRKIVVNQHCFGCTANGGSSCGGEVV